MTEGSTRGVGGGKATRRLDRDVPPMDDMTVSEAEGEGAVGEEQKREPEELAARVAEEEEEDADVREAEMADTGTPRLTREEVDQGIARMDQHVDRESRDQSAGTDASSSSGGSYQKQFVNKAPNELPTCN